MQSYGLNITPGQVQPFTLTADLFVYESGATVPTGGETRIMVKADSGAEIVLRPGQRFRLAAEDGKATRWAVHALDPLATVTGSVIIGSGEFDDANTLNKFTLDASLANNVTVMNGAGNRVLVALDPNVLLNIAGNTVNYTNAWSDAAVGEVVATPIFSPAANVNGAYIEFAEISMAGSSSTTPTVTSLIAKASAPTSGTDGDVLMVTVLGAILTNNGAAPFVNDKLGVRIKIAPGKGLWLNSVGVTYPTASKKTVLYTLL